MPSARTTAIPEPDEIAACRPWLEQQLALIDPKVVVTLGNFATKLLLETKEGITKLRGRSYPFRNGVLIPTFHPAAVLRGGGEPLAQMRADLVRAKQALAACERSAHVTTVTLAGCGTELGGRNDTRLESATRASGCDLAPSAATSLLLAGELGAGKTAFAQGFGVALGVTEPITSPTFMLARDYEDGRLPLHHLDVYRLEQMSEVYDLGLPEMLDEGGVTLIEWGDAIMPSLPADFLEVRLTFGDGRRRSHDRRARRSGRSWSARDQRARVARSQTWAAPVSGAAGC